ncbi:MAG: hypothetical protein RR346_07195 [Bacteroidales bacterium]
MRREKKQQRNVAGEIQSMLKKALNTQIPVIIDTPPSAMNPKTVHLSKEAFDSYNFEMVNSADCNISPISKARDSVRFNKAVNAFRQAGIPANSYTHIGYYQIPTTEEDTSKRYRYMLLW